MDGGGGEKRGLEQEGGLAGAGGLRRLDPCVVLLGTFGVSVCLVLSVPTWPGLQACLPSPFQRLEWGVDCSLMEA